MLTLPAEVLLRHNYTLSRAPTDAVARIVAWYGDLGTDVAPELLQSIENALRAPSARMRGIVVKAMKAAREAGFLQESVKVTKTHNLVPSIFRNALANLFAGNTPGTTFEINELALGSDSTAATNADTTLGTEELRTAFTDKSAAANIASLDVFFSAAEVGGNTYSEAGAFADGDGNPDSGYLASRVVINEPMGVNETLTVNVTIEVV